MSGGVSNGGYGPDEVREPNIRDGYGVAPEQKQRLRDLWVRELYTEEGARIWVADAEKKGHDISTQLDRLAQLRDGAFV